MLLFSTAQQCVRTSGDTLFRDDCPLIGTSLIFIFTSSAECILIHLKPLTFTFSKFQVPKQDYFVCDEIGYLFSNIRFLLSWRNLSGNFTVFWNNRQFGKVVTTNIHPPGIPAGISLLYNCHRLRFWLHPPVQMDPFWRRRKFKPSPPKDRIDVLILELPKISFGHFSMSTPLDFWWAIKYNVKVYPFYFTYFSNDFSSL